MAERAIPPAMARHVMQDLETCALMETGTGKASLTSNQKQHSRHDSSGSAAIGGAARCVLHGSPGGLEWKASYLTRQERL